MHPDYLCHPPGRRCLRVQWCCHRNPSRPVLAVPFLAEEHGSSGIRRSVRDTSPIPICEPWTSPEPLAASTSDNWTNAWRTSSREVPGRCRTPSNVGVPSLAANPS